MATADTVVSRDGTVLAHTVERGAIVVDAVPIRRRAVDLLDRLERALAPLEHQARDADVTLTLSAKPPALPPVTVDGEKLAWAVSTLVGNALRYVRRGSRHRPGGSVAVDLEIDAKELRVRVTDDGPGLPAGVVAMFEGTAHEGAPALTLVRDIVAAQGGRVEARVGHGDDHGTTLVLHLPR